MQEATICEIVLFCPGKNFMYVWLYVFISQTRACVCRCDGEVICVGRVGERTPPCGPPVLN